MSKVDALRALREAKYTAAARPAVTAAPRPAAAPAPARKPPPAASVAEEPSADSRCGHRSMNSRTCTRELGHPEKNHRYG